MERIQIQGINVTVTEAIRNHVNAVFDPVVERFHPSRCRLTFEKVKLHFHVNVILKNDDGEFVISGKGDELYSTIRQQVKQLTQSVDKARKRRIDAKRRLPEDQLANEEEVDAME
jgi:ribosomal subunit interface protein